MYNWCGEKMSLPMWFHPNIEQDVSWQQIQELYDSGINVMILS
jgi:hypothetical protein